MGDNLPPGVSVSDLPESRWPIECAKCGDEIYEPNSAIREGVPLCEDHATEDNIEEQKEFMKENAREKSGIECSVCGKPLMRSEVDYDNGMPFCENHTRDDFRERPDEAPEEDVGRYKDSL